MSWQEIIKEFRAEEGEHDGFAASLLLMYLSLGEDTAYNAAKEFKKNLLTENGWDPRTLRAMRKVKDPNQLNILMNDMEQKGLLLSKKETTGRRRRFFRLDPMIIYFTETTNKGREIARLLAVYSSGFDEAADAEAISGLLKMLEKNDRKEFFKIWSQIATFDFIHFLKFLLQEATKLKMERAIRTISDNLSYIRFLQNPGGLDVEPFKRL